MCKESIRPSVKGIRLSTGHVHEENDAGEAVPGLWHVEELNAFTFEADSSSLPLPAGQTTALRFFIFLLTPANADPQERATKSKTGRHASPDHSLIDSERGRNCKKEKKQKQRGKERKDS